MPSGSSDLLTTDTWGAGPTVTVNANVARLMRFGNQLVSLGGGVRYWLDSPDRGAGSLGLRITVTLLFPR